LVHLRGLVHGTSNKQYLSPHFDDLVN
jgi:hypothetical protein